MKDGQKIIQTLLRLKQRSKREAQHLFTGEANKIALGFNDDKRLQKIYIEQNHMRIKQVLKKYAKKNCQNILKQRN